MAGWGRAANLPLFRAELTMNVLALASYPVEAAATRFRLQQFVEPLAARGITLSIHPFLNSEQFKRLYRQESWPQTALGFIASSLRRVTDLWSARRADVILVQREAMVFGPPLVEWFTARALKRPLVLDLDDATYISYTSPTYGGLGKALKWPGKTDELIRWATIVICGNRGIAEYVSSKGTSSRIIPTVVDTDIFRPVSRPDAGYPIVVGWIGTHSTFPYLESIFPVLSDLAQRHKFQLRVVGTGRESVTVPGVEVENLTWDIDREVRDFQSIDIGLYPIDASLYQGWASGKSGFKAVQYMAVGVPYVASPVGGSVEIGEEGTTHLFARTNEEWFRALDSLLADVSQRRLMGEAGRRHALENYGLDIQADNLAATLREAAARQ